MEEKDNPILIVEDEEILSFLMIKLIKNLGFSNVTRCTSGEEAIRISKTTPPDVILMDIKLSGVLDGIQTFEIIKKHAPNVKVIYLTGNSDVTTRERASKTGFAFYLSKPIPPKQLKQVMYEALGLENPDANASPF